MSTYEFAFASDLKSNLSQEIIDTLKYMTRSEEYEFETNSKHDLFTRSWAGGSFTDPAESESEFDDEFRDEFTCLADCKIMISNIPSYGEELLSGLLSTGSRTSFATPVRLFQCLAIVRQYLDRYYYSQTLFVDPLLIRVACQRQSNPLPFPYSASHQYP